MRSCLFLIICFLVATRWGYCQIDQIDRISTYPDTLFVLKKRCKSDSSKYTLVISESKKNKPVESNCDFTYNNLYMAKAELKLKLAEQLLAFEEDTSDICCKVYCYRKTFLKYRKKIKSDSYSVQISALFHINMIFFGAFANFYAPYPVLIDTVTNQEVNESSHAVQDVFEVYKKWYNENKRTSFTNFSFPLLNSRYKWAYGDQTKKTFQELPVYKSDFRFSLGKKVTE